MGHWHEEIGIETSVKHAELVHLQSWLGNDGHRVNAYFRIHDWLGEPSNKEPDKCQLAAWFDLASLPAPMVPCSSPAVLHDILSGVRYSEGGW